MERGREGEGEKEMVEGRLDRGGEGRGEGKKKG